jgi:hypothetical protein
VFFRSTPEVVAFAVELGLEDWGVHMDLFQFTKIKEAQHHRILSV